MTILALDQGTTSSRLFAFGDGPPRRIGQLRHQTTHPAPGHVEQDPTEILANCRALLAGAGPAAAIGLANQGESCLAWDAVSGVPLSPILVWQDRRTLPELARMQAHAPEVLARSGLPLDPYFSAAKLGWLVANLPAVAEAQARRTLRLGTTDAFLLDRLAGCFATDRATASRTGLMNLATGTWDARLCGLFGVPMDALPEIRANTAGFGAVQGIPVAAAIVDQQAALCGHGCRNPGDGKVTFGTGAFALALSGRQPDPMNLDGLIPTVAWDLGTGPAWALDGGVPDAGAAVEWALRAGIADSLADFDGYSAPPAAARGLVFLPAFSGLGAPHWDRTAAPLLIGLTPEMTRRDICQALLEGVAFQTATLLDTLARHVPLANPVSVDGGLSASRYFTQLLAQLSGRPVLVQGFGECTALGAASLAALAIGRDLPPVDAAATLVPADTPRPAWSDRISAAIDRMHGWNG